MIASTISARSMFFGAAFSAAGALALYHERQAGLESGVLRVGGRGGVTLIPLSTDPTNFELWVSIYAAGIGFCVAMCLASLFFGVKELRANNK